MPVRVFKHLFPKSMIGKACITKNNSVMLKTCNQSGIEQLGMCTVKLSVKCRCFVVPNDGPALLGMPNIELLSIVQITCKVISEPHESRSRKFDSQTIKTSNIPSCRTTKALQIKTDRVDVHDGKINMPD